MGGPAFDCTENFLPKNPLLRDLYVADLSFSVRNKEMGATVRADEACEMRTVGNLDFLQQEDFLAQKDIRRPSRLDVRQQAALRHRRTSGEKQQDYKKDGWNCAQTITRPHRSSIHQALRDFGGMTNLTAK